MVLLITKSCHTISPLKQKTSQVAVEFTNILWTCTVSYISLQSSTTFSLWCCHCYYWSHYSTWCDIFCLAWYYWCGHRHCVSVISGCWCGSCCCVTTTCEHCDHDRHVKSVDMTVWPECLWPFCDAVVVPICGSDYPCTSSFMSLERMTAALNNHDQPI